MLKLIVPLVIVFALASGGFFLYQNSQKKPVNQTSSSPKAISTSTPSVQSPTASPVTKANPCEVLTKGSVDVPPLYKEGITWQKPAVTEYEVPLAEGSRKMNGCLIKSSEIEFSSASKARSFYTSEALNKGWSSISSSDLPGEAGSDTWDKDSKYILFEILPLKKPNVQIVLFYTQ